MHIPFCVKKCDYCDFLSGPADAESQKAYVKALQKEIQAVFLPEGYEVTSLFVGGGTPSSIDAGLIEEILSSLKKKFVFSPDAEVTMEANPGTLTREKLAVYRRAGINRLSLGLQSADNEELRMLGRIHTFEEFLESFSLARETGFDNINVDLMSAIPGQSYEGWVYNLRTVAELGPEHISAYSLIVEEGTPFYERYEEDVKRREAGEACRDLPSEEDERSMYELTEQYLARSGMYRYEISNYAKPGYECRHNCGYWRRIDYAGFGLGASSLLENVRYHNPEHLAAYIRGDFSGREKEILSLQDQMSEYMFLGLRMTEGVSEQQFFERFGVGIERIYGEPLQKLTNEKLLFRKNGYVCLTDRGRDLANPVMAEFLL